MQIKLILCNGLSKYDQLINCHVTEKKLLKTETGFRKQCKFQLLYSIGVVLKDWKGTYDCLKGVQIRRFRGPFFYLHLKGKFAL